MIHLPIEIIGIISNYLSSKDVVKNNLFVLLTNKYRKSFYIEDWMYSAVYGNLKFIKWLYKHKPILLILADIMDNAAYNGNLNVIKFLHKKGYRGTKYTTYNAVISGKLQLIKWFHRKDYKFSQHAMDAAAMLGYLKILKWLNKYRSEGCTSWAFDFSAANGHLRILKWLHENIKNAKCTNMTAIDAAINGQLHILKWMYKNSKENINLEEVLDYAERNRHDDIVNWSYVIIRRKYFIITLIVLLIILLIIGLLLAFAVIISM
jgi:hypothetical protein